MAPDGASTTPTNVWEHHSEQRRQANASVKGDVGLHRPTMAQLQPVLALIDSGETSGRAVFDAFQATQATTTRPIVTTVRMDTGYVTSQLDEGKVLSAVLHGNRTRGLERGLNDIVQLKIDTDTRQLVWGLASFEAASVLENVAFKIPTKDGMQTFTMTSTHALDGFFVEIVGFNVDLEAQAHLWEVLAKCGAMPVAGMYTNTSKAYGATGSRYRVSFRGNNVPAVFKKDGRLLDEIVFLGQLYRVYPKGWFASRDRRFNRADLDQYARDVKVPPMKKPAAAPPVATRNPTTPKRQRVDEEAVPWSYVSKGAAAGSNGTARSWLSPNMYDALDAHVSLSTETVYSADKRDLSIVPAVLYRPDAPVQPALGEFVGGTKVKANKAVRVEVPLQTVLDEFAALDNAATATKAGFEATSQGAAANTTLDLARHIRAGEADWIQRDLEEHPLVFRRQLEDIALTEPALFRSLLHLRVLSRWFRASLGAAQHFKKVYATVFGHSFDIDSLASDVESLTTASTLLPSYDSSDGSSPATPVSTEATVALAELVLASTAPLFYANDSALFKVSGVPVFAIPARKRSRYLSSATICYVLWGQTLLGSTIRATMSSLLQSAIGAAQHEAQLAACDATGDNDVDMNVDHPVLDALATDLDTWRQCLVALDGLTEFDDLSIAPKNQVMYDTSSGTLVHGDLLTLWTDATDGPPRC